MEGRFCQYLSVLGFKPIVQLLLISIFLQFFGLPSIHRFMDKRMLSVTSKKNTGGLAAPVVTIAPRNPRTKRGWSGNTTSYPKVVEDVCGHQQEAIGGCIQNETFSNSDAFKDVILGFTEKKSLLEQEGLLTEDFTTSWYGRTYTLDIHRKIGPDDKLDQFFLVLGRNLDYRIFVHDPTYFVINTNPIGLPSLVFKIKTNESRSHYYQITLTEMEEVDHPEDPCETDSNYNFQTCVKESLSKQVGCRLPWDPSTNQDLPKCGSLNEYRCLAFLLLLKQKIKINMICRHFETLYQDISVAEGQSLEKLTGCKKPCKYRKYEVIGGKQPTSFKSEHFTLSFWAVSNETTVWTEVPVYPWTSLVAEFGGTLSLFLGFFFSACMAVLGGLKNLLSLFWSKYHGSWQYNSS